MVRRKVAAQEAIQAQRGKGGGPAAAVQGAAVRARRCARGRRARQRRHFLMRLVAVLKLLCDLPPPVSGSWADCSCERGLMIGLVQMFVCNAHAVL